MKLEYIYNPNCSEAKELIDALLDILQYSDYECGELERLRTELRNTQVVLANLIVILAATGVDLSAFFSHLKCKEMK